MEYVPRIGYICSAMCSLDDVKPIVKATLFFVSFRKDVMKAAKKKEVLFTVFICAIMVSFMGFFTRSVQFHTLSFGALVQSIEHFPLAYLFALSIELLAVSKLAKGIAFRIARPSENSQRIILLVISFCMVCCMSFCMTWFGAFQQHGFAFEVFPTFFRNWPPCFMVALFFQWLFAGPFSRFVFRQLA